MPSLSEVRAKYAASKVAKAAFTPEERSSEVMELLSLIQERQNPPKSVMERLADKYKGRDEELAESTLEDGAEPIARAIGNAIKTASSFIFKRVIKAGLSMFWNVFKSVVSGIVRYAIMPFLELAGAFLVSPVGLILLSGTAIGYLIYKVFFKGETPEAKKKEDLEKEAASNPVNKVNADEEYSKALEKVFDKTFGPDDIPGGGSQSLLMQLLLNRLLTARLNASQNTSPPSGRMPPPSGSGSGRSAKGINDPYIIGIANAFVKFGWTQAQAAGIAANILQESGGDPNVRPGDNGKAVGIGQWWPDRQARFVKLFGKPIEGSSLDEQIRFYQWELENSEKRAGDLLKSATTPFQAGSIVSQYFERPKAVEYEKSLRGGMAEGIYRNMVKSPTIPLPAPGSPPATPQVPRAANPDGDQPQQSTPTLPSDSKPPTNKEYGKAPDGTPLQVGS